MKRMTAVFVALLVFLAFPVSAYASTGDGGMLDGLVDGIVEGLKSLFVPDNGFFEMHINHMQGAIDNKTGGLATYFSTITNEFNRLQSGHQTNSVLKLTMPDNLLYNGYRGTTVNLLGGIGDFANWFKGLFTAFMVVTTVITCYRKLIGLFRE